MSDKDEKTNFNYLTFFYISSKNKKINSKSKFQLTIQFEIKELYKQTPCKHTFHDQCLSDWTIKQGNCPVCRQSLQEIDIQKLQEQKTQLPQLNLEVNEKVELKECEQQQSDRAALYIHFVPTPYRTSCRIDLDNSPQGEHSPQTVQFDGTPNHQSERDLCQKQDRIVESQI